MKMKLLLYSTPRSDASSSEPPFLRLPIRLDSLYYYSPIERLCLAFTIASLTTLSAAAIPSSPPSVGHQVSAVVQSEHALLTSTKRKLNYMEIDKLGADNIIIMMKAANLRSLHHHGHQHHAQPEYIILKASNGASIQYIRGRFVVAAL